MLSLTREQMLAASRRNDRGFDGRFYVGVHSTGIYCLPSCKARPPRPENIEFYATREEAIAAGLRGCRRCRAESYPDVMPAWLHRLLAFMQQHRSERLTENDLIRITGADISTVRRYFRAHFDSTPLAFHRRIRLQQARQLLKAGGNYLSVAFECGYESASGFREAFIRQYGVPPGSIHAE